MRGGKAISKQWGKKKYKYIRITAHSSCLSVNAVISIYKCLCKMFFKRWWIVWIQQNTVQNETTWLRLKKRLGCPDGPVDNTWMLYWEAGAAGAAGASKKQIKCYPFTCAWTEIKSMFMFQLSIFFLVLHYPALTQCRAKDTWLPLC